ncbi:MAG: bifunctional glutamate N-acetyltransferase/amino-acid acetyltransferase ArgJ [Candidatus Omnitrophota bacterium]
MKRIKGNVSAPEGFEANGIACGLKRSGKPDLSLIYSQVPCVCAGVFTKNSIKAAPLVISQERLQGNCAIQAIIANSGNANCFTGHPGLLHAKQMTELTAKVLNIQPKNVLVASTGIIGRKLPIDKIRAGIPKLVNGLCKSGGMKAARGILTTDKKVKELTVEIKLGNRKAHLGAIAKGSGMIAPNMATMLGFITTDAAISRSMLKIALKNAVNHSFNNITVDGCMSTNDMVVVMANGLAQNKKITKPGKDFTAFCKALDLICLDCAKKIVLDAEGGTKFIEVSVHGAKTQAQAKQAALAIANSNLVKTAAYGSNPNWGRVAAAVGSLGLPISEKQMKIKFSSFKTKNINISVNLNLGRASSTVYTSDLSLDYVRINGKYN